MKELEKPNKGGENMKKKIATISAIMVLVVGMNTGIIEAFPGDINGSDFQLLNSEIPVKYQGEVEFYISLGNGDMELVKKYDRARTTWGIIVPGNFGGNSHTDLLFYDPIKGEVEFYISLGNGDMELVKKYDRARKTCGIIVPGNFGGNNYTDLLFYDQETRRQLLATISIGKLRSSYKPGDTVKIDTYVHNTGNTSHTFIVGCSIIDSDRDVYDIPYKKAKINPGEWKHVQFSYKIPTNALEGEYHVIASVWEKDAGRGKLVNRLDRDDKYFTVQTFSNKHFLLPVLFFFSPFQVEMVLQGRKCLLEL